MQADATPPTPSDSRSDSRARHRSRHECRGRASGGAAARVSSRTHGASYARTLAAALLLALIAPGMPGTAWAQDDAATDTATDTATDPTADAIARLTVVPHGEQSFDLLTGETTLPDGGVIVDTETGLRLDAGFVRYREGDFIEARDATAETAGGSLAAPALRIDVATLVAAAPEGVRYVREGLELVADAAELRFGPELVRFEHPTGASLDLEARALLLDIRTGDALLLGPYRFQDGPFVLTDDRDDAALQLRPVTTDAGTPTYRAANEVDEDLWTRMAPLR